MAITANPITERRLQARTKLLVTMYEPNPYRDYGSYGHESDDICWWYDDGEIHVANGEEYHHHILGDSDRDESPDEIAEDYVRGRYSPINECISLLPALADNGNLGYNIPREVFRELEATFPDASEIEVF